MSTPLLQTKDLQLAFGAVVVADHIDFSLSEGERLAVIGQNGAGFDIVGNTPFAYPCILFGHNGRISWGSTAGVGDALDLPADGKLAPGDEWVQESIVGSVFRGKYRKQGDKIIPTITGTAFVNSEATLLLDEKDPFCWGIR